MIRQLTQTFKPQSYNLTLDIDTDKLTFLGEVTVTGNLLEESQELTLHSKGLSVTSAVVNNVSVATSSAKNDELVLTTKDKFPRGETVVNIKFSGIITEGMHGMYPCYFEHEGKHKKLIATQFESHHAREVFPCIDEPAAKATFNVELITPIAVTVLGNTPVSEQNERDGKLITRFETTPRMSTYLLAFAFGEMVSKEAKTKDGVVVKSWASAAQDPAWLDFSVQEAVSYIEFYNDYFGIPYPLEKCDQVALPDFDSGAMENWGLVTYRELTLLSDPKNPSLSTKQLIAIVTAHELSHQWFGNLVTMQWWDDLWLNESFASMMEYIAVDALHPEWQMWEDYVSQDVISAANRDVYSDVQPVRVDVDDPSEIGTLFDPSIVYAKGGKLLKGLHDLIGEKAWKAGLNEYFKKHAYQNTIRDDLWQAFSNHTDVDVPNLMNTWIEKPGQPLLEVSQVENKLRLKQQRLTLDKNTDSTTWRIPLLTAEAPAMFSGASAEFELKTNDKVLVNTTGVGHYIANYLEPDHKAWVTERIGDTNTPSEWKIAHLNGLVMLARHGDTTLAEALETISGTSHEPRAAVWSQISHIIGSSRMLIDGDEKLENVIKHLCYNLSKYHLKNLGWEYTEADSSNDTHLRTTMISLAIASENMSVINKALELYQSAKNQEELPAELRGMLMGVAVRFGNPDEFEKLIELYKKSSNADFKADINAALASTKKPEQAKVLTELMLDTSVVRTQDTIRWYVYILRNRYTREVAWHWLTTNWNWILEHFGGGKSYDSFARYSATLFNSDTHLKQYKEFFEPKSEDPALRRAIAIGITEITAKSNWRKRDKKAVAAWLERYSSKNPT